MIASVVATLSDQSRPLPDIVAELASLPGVEAGQLTQQRVPLTIDASGHRDVEDITRWIQDREGVVFVDVVFVHFETAARDGAHE